MAGSGFAAEWLGASDWISVGTPAAIGNSQTKTMTTTANILAGDLVLVAYSATGGGSVSSVSDGTNTYSLATRFSSSAGTVIVELWYVANAQAVGSGATITVTHAGSGNECLGAARCVMSPAPSVIDKTATADLSLSVATGTLTSASQLIIGVLGGDNWTTTTESSGFTNLVSVQHGANQVWINFGYKIASTPASVTYNPSASGGAGLASYGTMVATFKKK